MLDLCIEIGTGFQNCTTCLDFTSLNEIQDASLSDIDDLISMVYGASRSTRIGSSKAMMTGSRSGGPGAV